MESFLVEKGPHLATNCFVRIKGENEEYLQMV